ncbi:DeoR/GlpR family DNA-binding transcription regulator [Paenibacillus filicis]|uniref:DeoR/GlpR family DNA-binding transcription regulator n=1 Tax=Paenibacillus filicis TaxID=669464 RepID=A0ABU9DMC0_9BACL
MIQEERLKAIVDFLEVHESIRVEQICEMFQISRDSARRDLVKLEEQNRVIRTHGGAILQGGQQPLLAYGERTEHHQAKQSIGRAAAERIRDGETLFMDASTTVQLAAEAITATGVTVITNSIDIAGILGKRPGIKVHLLGGEFHSWNRNVTGVHTIRMISEFQVDTLLLGACSVVETGLSSPYLDEAYVKKEMIGHAQRVIVLADQSKFRKSFLHAVCDFDEIDLLVTDADPPAEISAQLNRHEVSILVAGQSSSPDSEA